MIKNIAFAAVAAVFFAAPAMAAADWPKVDKAMGRPGAEQPGGSTGTRSRARTLRSRSTAWRSSRHWRSARGPLFSRWAIRPWSWAISC